MNLDFDLLDYIVRALGLLSPAETVGPDWRWQKASQTCFTDSLRCCVRAAVQLHVRFSAAAAAAGIAAAQVQDPGENLLTADEFREYCEYYELINSEGVCMKTDVEDDQKLEIDRERRCAFIK